MADSRYDDLEGPAPKKRRAPATSPEGRELQLIAMAYEEAEKQILEGRASSQLLTHFVKAGSSRDKVEKERLEREVELLNRKIEGMEAAVRVEGLIDEAFAAFRGYSGQRDEQEEF